jgi:hypothetical protein
MSEQPLIFDLGKRAADDARAGRSTFAHAAMLRSIRRNSGPTLHGTRKSRADRHSTR